MEEKIIYLLTTELVDDVEEDFYTARAFSSLEKAKAEMQISIKDYKNNFLENEDIGNFEIEETDTYYSSFKIGWYAKHHFITNIERVFLE